MNLQVVQHTLLDLNEASQCTQDLLELQRDVKASLIAMHGDFLVSGLPSLYPERSGECSTSSQVHPSPPGPAKGQLT